MSAQYPQGQATAVPIAAIRFDPRAWPRQRVDEERVALFASLYQEQGPSALPPLEVVGEHLLLSDGLTRARAAAAAGLKELPVLAVPAPEGADEVSFAFCRAVRAATGGHKELTRAERQAGIRRLLKETDLPDAEIAGLFGVSRTTVLRQRHGSADAPAARDAGERHLASTAATEVAARLLRGIENVYEARGLGVWDALTGDHTGRRLARTLSEAYGSEALANAERFRGWFDEAIASLRGEARR